MTPRTRRDFIKTTALASAALSLPGLADASQAAAVAAPSVSIFSKHLQFLDYSDMAQAAAAIGFDGVDLTVRPNGHVLPENVARDLPRAVEAIREAGLDTPMMTTAVDDAQSPTDQAVLKEATRRGIPRYRMNWFAYKESLSMPEALVPYTETVHELSELNRELGLVGCYQNHAGTLVGASLWEVWQLLQGSLPDHFGAQYDIRHATVEGGLSWPNGLRLVLPRIKTVAIKDFKWTQENGRTKIVNTPIGEGMVDFKKYFRILKENKIDVPMSLHLEYDIGGAQWGRSELTVDRDAVYEAMRRDLETTRALWKEA